MKRICVVEDDDNIREVVEEYLRDKEFETVSFSNGREARDYIEQSFRNEDNKIDLFVLDIMLPEVSGLDILKMIRSYNSTPIIMLTALSDELTQLSSFNSLADDYVTKPFSPKILIKRIEAIFRRGAEEHKILEINDITVDVESYEAYESGKKILLTLKELELLKALLNNKGKVLNRQQLLDIVWGYDYFGDERIVDVHIKNLRKKFKTPIITTVKGVGYKI